MAQEVRAPPLAHLFAAVAGPVAAALCLVLTPVQSRVWNGADSPALVRTVDPFVDLLLGLRSRIAPGVDDYHFFGRFFFLVYLLALAGLWAFHHRARAEGDRRERTAFRVLAVGLAVGALADLGPYWGGLESPIRGAVHPRGARPAGHPGGGDPLRTGSAARRVSSPVARLALRPGWPRGAPRDVDHRVLPARDRPAVHGRRGGGGYPRTRPGLADRSPQRSRFTGCSVIRHDHLRGEPCFPQRHRVGGGLASGRRSVRRFSNSRG